MEQIKNYINTIPYIQILGDYLVSEWIPYKIENEAKFKALSKEITSFKLNVNDKINKFRLELPCSIISPSV